MTKKTDIILVGYGPTAAVLANLLAPLGWSIDIFDQNKEIYELPRAVFFDDEVMRVFQHIQLGQELLDCTVVVQGMEFLNHSGNVLASYDAPKTLGINGWHAGYMFHQPTLEKILRNKIESYPNVRVHLNHKVIGVFNRDHEAYIEVQGPQGSEEYSGKFVIGCCGAKSITRKAFDAELRDYDANQAWIVIDFELLSDLELPSKTIQYCNPSRPSTFIPLPGNLRRFEIMLMPGETPESISDPKKIAQLLSEWIQPEHYRVVRSAVYEFHALMVGRWRSGSIFLAGDAAHQMPPFLGQGMCSGIKDASNLYWKLDLFLRGISSGTLLDTYQSERKPYVNQVIESDLWLGNMIQTTDPETAKQRDMHFLSAPPTETQLQPPQIKLGGEIFQDNLAGLPFPQTISSNEVRYDSSLGHMLTLIGKMDLPDHALGLINLGIIKLIEEPPLEIQTWLDEQGVKAVLVRPDKYVQALIDSPGTLAQALEYLGLLNS
jgi:3-(3-hydroxy-phenyl)propionate hydroxylase